MSNRRPDPARVAARALTAATDDAPSAERVAARSMLRVAGEVRFIKDKSGDSNQWAWNDAGPQERKITPDFAFDPRNTKPLAEVLRSSTAALGHAMRAYTIFTKIKSADVSPDGSLGGKGYIQKIAEMRRAYMNVVEALSAMSDTLYDEIRAPHWAALSRQEDPEEKAEIEEIVGDALEIKKDPEAWAKEEEEEMDADNGPVKKTAFLPPPRVAPTDFGFPIKLLRDLLGRMDKAPYTSCEPTNSTDYPMENDVPWVKGCLKSALNVLLHINRPSQVSLAEAHLKRAVLFAEHNANLDEVPGNLVAGNCSTVAWQVVENDIRFILTYLYPSLRK